MTFALPLRHAAAAAPSPCASVAAFDDFEAVRDAWAELEAAGGAYQRFAFAKAFHESTGARDRLALAVARDAAGRPVALLPLVVSRSPVRVARFLGDKWANYHLGLYRPGLDWSAESVRCLLRQTAKSAGIDLFAFKNQPASWEGLANPLALLPHRPSPDAAFATTLSPSPDWLDAHFSRATQKKMRKKARKLDVFGEAAHRRAATTEEASGYLDAFLAHKMTHPDAPLFAAPAVHRLLRRFVANGVMEFHALVAGERIAATFGALAGGRRLSGLILSFDPDPAVAAASPGELLLIEVARDARERGFDTLDLGVGASRYKREICEIEEPLFDSAIPASLLGWAAAPAFYASRDALRWVKANPRLRSLATRARRGFSST